MKYSVPQETKLKGQYCPTVVAAAAKSLQSCLTLCDPIDGSPPGSSVHGILQARTLEWVAISFSNAWKWKVKVKSLSHVWLFTTPWTAVYQAPPSMGFSRQECWSGVPLPSPLSHYSFLNTMLGKVTILPALSLWRWDSSISWTVLGPKGSVLSWWVERMLRASGWSAHDLQPTHASATGYCSHGEEIFWHLLPPSLSV